MPYIKDEDRPKFSNILSQLPDFETKGELEYCVFYLMQKFMDNRLFKYSPLHACVYAVQHCADEFRRRFLDMREDDARITNGDIDV